jgi:hypothetical protein
MNFDEMNLQKFYQINSKRCPGLSKFTNHYCLSLSDCPPDSLSICLFVHLYVCPSVRSSIFLFVQLSICPYVHLSICPFVHLSICPSVHLSICLFAYLSVCPSVRLSINPYVHLPICLSVRLFVCPYVHLSVSPSAPFVCVSLYLSNSRFLSVFLSTGLPVCLFKLSLKMDKCSIYCVLN